MFDTVDLILLHAVLTTDLILFHIVDITALIEFNTVVITLFIEPQTVLIVDLMLCMTLDIVCFIAFQTSPAFAFIVSQLVYKATPIAINAAITPITIPIGPSKAVIPIPKPDATADKLANKLIIGPTTAIKTPKTPTTTSIACVSLGFSFAQFATFSTASTNLVTNGSKTGNNFSPIVPAVSINFCLSNFICIPKLCASCFASPFALDDCLTISLYTAIIFSLSES